MLIFFNEPIYEFFIFDFKILFFPRLPDLALFLIEFFEKPSDLIQESEFSDIIFEDDFFALRAMLIFSSWLFKQDGLYTFLTCAMLLCTQDHREHSIVIVFLHTQGALKVFCLLPD